MTPLTYDLITRKVSGNRISSRQGTQKARKVILKHAEYLYMDRPLDNDHNTMKKLVKSGEILEEVEKVVGDLG
jgi:hypothetical protein